MSEEQLNAFREAIQADVELQQKLQGVSDPAVVVEIASEAGFTITASELREELSDEELAAVAGGGTNLQYLQYGDRPHYTIN